MPNVFHKNYTLDNNHALHARVYADIAARDADTAFNADSLNIGKAILVNSPASVFTLLTTAPLFLEFSNTTAGNVTTSDTLTATRVVLGNGGSDIVVAPDLFYMNNMLGIGLADPDSPLHIYRLDGTTGIDAGLTIEQDGNGDAVLHFKLSGNVTWTMGADTSQSGDYKINKGVDLGTDAEFTILSDTGFLGINEDNPTTRLHVNSTGGDTIAAVTTQVTGSNSASIRDFVGDRDPEGNITGNPGDYYHQVNGTSSGLFIFKAASAGTAGWEEVVTGLGVGNVTTSDTLVAGQLLVGNGVTDIVTEPGLFWDGTMLGIGTSSPDTELDILALNSDALRLRSGNTSGASTFNQIKMSFDDGLLHTHAIKTRHNPATTTGNAIDFYLWEEGVDAVGDVGTLQVMSIDANGRVSINKVDPSSVLDILSTGNDQMPVIQIATSTNAGEANFRVGDQDPNGVITGIGPDLYFRDEGVESGVYESRSASADTVWLKQSAFPADIIELHNSTELDALASGGIITIAANTTWHVRGPLTTANRIVVNDGIFFRITGEFNATASITYSGTATFISTNNGVIQLFAAVAINSSSTGIFFSSTGSFGGIVIQQCSLAFWTDLGSVTNGQLFAANTGLFNISGGMTLTNTIQVDLLAFNQFGTDLDGPLLTINTNNPNSIFFITDVAGRNLGTGALFDIDTRVHPSASMVITRVSAPNADIFKQSVLSNATINSVADGSIATGSITAMADNGSGGTTFSSTTTYFEDELATISGTTSYNGFFQIFNVVAGVSFDTITAFVADDATGSVDTERLTLTLAGGHGISTGDSIKVIDTNFYNAFYTTLNVATNDVTVNNAFVSTNTGAIVRELSLDQTDPRLMGFANRNIAHSHFIASAHVNDNSTVTGAIVNNTFTDMVFGTVGAALLANSTMERWKIVDELNGTFEYVGLEPFDGSISFDFTVLSSGGTTDFRFKWQIDEGSGFVDLPDPVEALAAVGSDSQSITKTYPLRALSGDQIKPQITRNSGTSTITSTYATVYASM